MRRAFLTSFLRFFAILLFISCGNSKEMVGYSKEQTDLSKKRPSLYECTQELANLDRFPEPTGSLTGTVKVGDVRFKTPIVNIKVAVYQENQEIACTTTNLEGHFNFTRLPVNKFVGKITYDLILEGKDYFALKKTDVVITAGQITEISSPLAIIPRNVRYVPGEIVVAFKPDVSDKEIENTISEAGYFTVPFGSLDPKSRLIKLPKGKSEAEAIEFFVRLPIVRYAEVNGIGEEAVPKKP